MRVSVFSITHSLEWRNGFNRDGINPTPRAPDIQADMPDEICWLEQARQVCYA
jgi:hypothetical protein